MGLRGAGGTGIERALEDPGGENFDTEERPADGQDTLDETRGPVDAGGHELGQDLLLLGRHDAVGGGGLGGLLGGGMPGLGDMMGGGMPGMGMPGMGKGGTRMASKADKDKKKAQRKKERQNKKRR